MSLTLLLSEAGSVGGEGSLDNCVKKDLWNFYPMILREYREE